MKEVVEEEQDLEPASPTNGTYRKAFGDYFIPRGAKFDIVRQLLRLPKDCTL